MFEKFKSVFLVLLFFAAMMTPVFAGLKPVPEPTAETVPTVGTIPGGTIPDDTPTPVEITPTDTPEVTPRYWYYLPIIWAGK